MKVKPIRIARLLEISLALGLCPLVSVHAASPASNPLLVQPATENELQLIVAAPASLELIRSDNVTGVLVTLIESVFQQSGFRGHIDPVTTGERLEGDAPTLEVYLLDWRITGSGSVDCTFTATLETAKGSTNLGVFTGATLPMLGLHNAFNRAEAFDLAATDAIGNLYAELREKNLLPASILY